MSVYSKNVSLKLTHAYKAGTNAGATATISAVSGKRIHLESIHGFNDAATIIEVRNALSGTVATSSGDATVTGTGTAFTTELEAGDTIRVTDTGEILVVSSITSDTSLEATANSSNNEASSAAVRLIAEFKPAAAGNINLAINGAIYGSVGKALDIALLSSTADCAVTAVGYTL